MSGGTEAGWYDDPLGRHESRYWDGTQWTEHVANAGIQANDPLSPPAPPTQPYATESTPPVGTPGVGEPAAPAPTDPTPPVGTPGVTDPTQPFATSAAPPPPGDTSTGLPQYANTGAQKSGGFPIVPVVIGLVVAAAVIGALVFFVGGGDDGDDFGQTTATLSDETVVVRYQLSLDRGEGVRFRATPRQPNLDPVFVMAVDQAEAEALFSDLLADDFVLEDADFDDVLDDVSDDVLSDFDEDATGVGSGELYSLEQFDCCGEGTREAHGFVAPRSADYVLLLYDYGGEEGELEVSIERWDGRAEFSDFSGFVDELSDTLSDDPFFTDGSFFSEFSEFSDFSDFIPPEFSDFSDLSDLIPPEFSDFSDLSEFVPPEFSDFSDLADPFSDLSDLSDFSDFSDFVDPFTDFFSEFASDFGDFASEFSDFGE